MEKLTVSASPHITKVGNTTRNIMLDVIIALMPAVIAATLFFGYHVIINVLVCAGACFGFELLYTFAAKKGFSKKIAKESSCWDFSCVVTGIILALNLPSKAIVKGWDFNVYRRMPELSTINRPDYIVFSGDTVLMCIIGSLFAIVLIKMLFGGIGKNFANPAATARIFLFIAFSFGFVNSMGMGESLAGSTGATWLSSDKTTSQNVLFNMLIGNRGSAAVGETCMVALLVGYVYLSIKKIIDFRVPLIIIGSTALFAFIFDCLVSRKLTDAALVNGVLANVMSGGIVFASIFMATDYSTSPNTFIGNVIFGVGIAFFTVIIRVYVPGLPEGTSYALLFMNLFVPLIDKFIYPKPFGAEKRPNAEYKEKNSQPDRPNAEFKEGKTA